MRITSCHQSDLHPDSQPESKLVLFLLFCFAVLRSSDSHAFVKAGVRGHIQAGATAKGAQWSSLTIMSTC